MVFLEKSHDPSFLLFLNCFRANQMAFEQFFHNLTFKCLTALTKKILSVVNYFLSYCFWIHAVLSNF